MELVKKPKKYALADYFLTILKNGSKDIHLTYYHLFSISDKKELQKILDYAKKVWSGKDKYYGKDGKENWFYIFHKSIRQTDFFDECYSKSEYISISKSKKAEFLFLFNKINEEGYDKENPKEKSQFFNDEYLRYLELRREKNERKMDRPITGHLDMILWHTIHLDKDSVLYETMEEIFKN